MDFLDIQNAVNLIIRPQRQQYTIQDLDRLTPNYCKRQDVVLQFGSGHIALSILSRSNIIDKAVIYLHSNTGSRLEGMAFASSLLQKYISLIIFDFYGCGMSSGEYITLGYKEVEQTEKVIIYLENHYPKIKFCIWGRSMGAVTTLRLNKNKSIKCSIIDSPFSNLQELSVNFADKQTFVPKFILMMYMSFVSKKIKQILNFQLSDVNTLNRGFNPALFLINKQDYLVPYKQMKEVYDTYKYKKQMIEINTQHNQRRHQEVIKKIIKFMNKHFSELNEKSPSRIQNMKKQKCELIKIRSSAMINLKVLANYVSKSLPRFNSQLVKKKWTDINNEQKILKQQGKKFAKQFF